MKFLEKLYFDSNFTEVSSLGLISNNSELVKAMAWHRTSDKSLLDQIGSGDYA